MTTLKTCFKCNEVKPLDEFYRHKQMADGHLNKCKECAKRDVGVHRLDNIERIREYDRGRANQPHRQALRGRIVTEWRRNHPDRYAAHCAVNNAVRNGLLTPLPCLVCGCEAEAHHPDYSRPLDVVWLCSVHHKQAHALVRKAA